MILLDTNVLSELTRPMPDPAVERWLAARLVADLFVSAITEAELRLGMAMLPPGKRRFLLAAATEDMLADDFTGRILPFDSPAAVAYADIVAHRRRAGRPISQSDAPIAATARAPRPRQRPDRGPPDRHDEHDPARDRRAEHRPCQHAGG